MPLIRCPKCGQAYDVPGVVAVRLPNSIATCHCGEWLSGSKAAILARLLNPDQIKEIDLQPYRVDVADPLDSTGAGKPAAPVDAPGPPRSIRVIARGAKDSVNSVFTIGEHPLWIGRKGCHVELPDSELDIRHCSIAVRGPDLVVRDANSHMGTFMDGKRVTEMVIGEGVHLLRVGTAMVSVEPTAEPGQPVEPIELDTNEIVGNVAEIEALRTRPIKTFSEERRMMLVCIDGPLSGQEYEIPPTGLVVGREGHVRVNDEFLSRRHFEVFAEADGTIRVRDLGSRNGTFLNTLPAHNTKVQSGDEIRAGVHRFRVEQRA
jgi:pSer/pThr/pTyr-binding forkhead associated (FHA) protein